MEGHKILVFGDERHLFRTICWVLENKGYYVRLVRRPEAALALLIEQNFDLVIARLDMEDLQSLDVLKRSKKLNPEVMIMVVSADSNAAFPLEVYRIEVDDYLLLPMTASELMRRVGQCLEKAAAVKAVMAAAAAKDAPIIQEMSSQILIMAHDIRSDLVSAAASLKLLKRGKYGALDSRVAEKVQELSDRIKHCTVLLENFAHERLAGRGQASNRDSAARPEPARAPKPDSRFIPSQLRF